MFDDVLAWSSGIALILLSIGLVTFIARRFDLVRPVLVAAVLYVTIAMTTKSLFGLIGDENAYQIEALGLLSQWQGGDPYIAGQPWTKLSISFLLALFYFVSIPNYFLGVLLLTPFFCCLPLLIGQASFNFFGGRRIRVISAWLAVFLPQTLIWSPLILREGLSFFVLSLGILGASLMYRQRILASTTLFAFCLLLMTLVRVQLTWVLLGLFIASSLFCAWDLRLKVWRLLSLASAWIIILSCFLVTQVVTNATVANVFSSQSLVTNSEVRQIIIDANSASGEGLAVATDPASGEGLAIATDPASGEGLAIATDPASGEGLAVATSVTRSTIQNLIPSLFGPFPWQWVGYGSVIAGLDGLAMLILVVLSILPFIIRWMRGAKVASVLWIGALPLILANAIALANYGIAMRVRANVALLLLPIAAYSLTQIFDSLKRLRSSKSISKPIDDC